MFCSYNSTLASLMYLWPFSIDDRRAVSKSRFACGISSTLSPRSSLSSSNTSSKSFFKHTLFISALLSSSSRYSSLSLTVAPARRSRSAVVLISASSSAFISAAALRSFFFAVTPTPLISCAIKSSLCAGSKLMPYSAKTNSENSDRAASTEMASPSFESAYRKCPRLFMMWCRARYTSLMSCSSAECTSSLRR